MKPVCSSNRNEIKKKQTLPLNIEQNKKTVNYYLGSSPTFQEKRMYNYQGCDSNSLKVSHTEHMNAHRPQPIKMKYVNKPLIAQQIEGSFINKIQIKKQQNIEEVNKKPASHLPVKLKNPTKRVQIQCSQMPDLRQNLKKQMKNPFEQILFEKNQSIQQRNQLQRYNYGNNQSQPWKNLTKIQLVESQSKIQNLQKQGGCFYCHSAYNIQIQNTGQKTFC